MPREGPGWENAKSDCRNEDGNGNHDERKTGVTGGAGVGHAADPQGEEATAGRGRSKPAE